MRVGQQSAGVQGIASDLTSLSVVLEAPEWISAHDLHLSAAADEGADVDSEFSGISTGTERLLRTGEMPSAPGLGDPLLPSHESVGRIGEAGPPVRSVDEALDGRGVYLHPLDRALELISTALSATLASIRCMAAILCFLLFDLYQVMRHGVRMTIEAMATFPTCSGSHGEALSACGGKRFARALQRPNIFRFIGEAAIVGQRIWYYECVVCSDRSLR